MYHGLNRSDKKIIEKNHGEGTFSKVRSIEKHKNKSIKKALHKASVGDKMHRSMSRINKGVSKLKELMK